MNIFADTMEALSSYMYKLLVIDFKFSENSSERCFDGTSGEIIDRRTMLDSELSQELHIALIVRSGKFEFNISQVSEKT